MNATEIDISWTATANTLKYNLFDGTTQIGGDITGTSFSHKGLGIATTHTYTIKACNGVGCSELSAAVSATTQDLSITVNEIKNTGDIRPYYAVFNIKANGIFNDYTLALKEGATPTTPTAAEMTTGLVYKRNLSETAINIYAWGAIGSTFPTTAITNAQVKDIILKPNTTYSLYGMPKGSTIVSKLKTFTTDAVPKSSSDVDIVYDASIYSNAVKTVKNFTFRKGEAVCWVLSANISVALFFANNSNNAILNDVLPDGSLTATSSGTYFYGTEQIMFGWINIFYVNSKLNSQSVDYFVREIQYNSQIKYFGWIIENDDKTTIPVITKQPSPPSLTVKENASATFNFEATVNDGPIEFQWQKAESDNPTVFKNLFRATYEAGVLGPYTFDATAADNGDLYRVVLSNTAGSVTSDVAILKVIWPPTITSQPVNKSIGINTTATFTVAATANNGTLSYQWQKAESTAPTTFTDIAGATGVSYTTPNATASEDLDVFRVKVTNESGSTTSNSAFLLVASNAPTITTHPADVTLLSRPDNVTFSVSASGGGLTYQWQQALASSSSVFVNIGGATATSYTKFAGDVDRGTKYRVIITNALGSVTSNAATLSIP